MADENNRSVNRVIPWIEWCERRGLSPSTGFRIRKKGLGPRITQLSERRIGVTEDDDRAWLESRATT